MPCPDCQVRAVASFYGVYDFTPWSQAAEGWKHSALSRLFGDWTPEMLREYSPIEHVRADLPPTLLVQGTKDELENGTLEYAARLKAVGARYDLLLLEGAPHGMENWEGHAEWAHYKQKLVDWLLTVLGSG
jgi:acetyl esterase/lipase